MTLPQTMNFIEVAQPGGPEAMRLATGPVPQPARRGSAGARGRRRSEPAPTCSSARVAYPPPPGASPHLGLEVAGGHRGRRPQA